MATNVVDRILTIGQELKTGGAGPFTYADRVTVRPDVIVLEGGDIRTYSIDNEDATAEGNNIDRPAPVALAEMYRYFLENQYKIDANEPANSPLLSRLAMVFTTGRAWIEARQQLNNTGAPVTTDLEWPDPSEIRPAFWPSTFRDAAGQGLTNVEHAECSALYDLLQAVAQGGGGAAEVDTTGSAFSQMLSSAVNCGVLSQAQRNELLGRRDNRQSRASEIFTGSWSEGDVEAARRLVP